MPLFKVFMPDDIMEELQKTLYSGYISCGEKTEQFEYELSKLITNPNVVATNSGSSALALLLSGIGYGDEVISSALTCPTVNGYLWHTGCKIRFADIDIHNGDISVESILENITPKTKAIVFSHTLGSMANVGAIIDIAKKHDLITIEYAASVLGSEYDKRPIGSHSDYSVFSFQAVKHLNTGDGGALAV